MQIIGFNFTKIAAERRKTPEGKIEIKSNINLKSITPEKFDLIKDKDTLRMDFEFFVEYLPDIARISFEGSVIVSLDKNQSKEIQKKWKNKKIEEDLRLPIFNMILAKCNLKALQIEEEFSLPTHVPLPRLTPPQNNQGYVQ